MHELKEYLRKIEGLDQRDLWHEIERRAQMPSEPVPTMSPSHSTAGRRVRAGLVAAAIVTVVAFLAWGAFGPRGRTAESTPTPSASRSCSPSNIQGIAFQNCEPFFDATKYPSLVAAEAGSAAVGTLPRPNVSVANDDEIIDVWIGPSNGQVQIDYANGVSVQYEAAPSKIADLSVAELTARYQEQAAEDASQTRGQARMQIIDGVPTVVVPTDSALLANGVSQNAGGSVEFVLGRRSLAIAGHIPTSDLVGVADSVIQQGVPRRFGLRAGENRLNLASGLARPGDIIICQGASIRVPSAGTHSGTSGRVWSVTSVTGSISMGCGTNVVFGTLT